MIGQAGQTDAWPVGQRQPDAVGRPVRAALVAVLSGSQATVPVGTVRVFS
jgi:hypothetical protein